MIEINAGFRHHFLAIAQAQLQTRYYRTHSGPKGVTVPDALCCTRNYDTSNFCHSSPNSLLAQWRWKRVPAVIIGAVGGASIPAQPSSVPLIPNFHDLVPTPSPPYFSHRVLCMETCRGRIG